MEGGKASRRVDLVVKVGGSAITNKTVRQSFNDAAAHETAILFKQLHAERTTAILIHGAGRKLK